LLARYKFRLTNWTLDQYASLADVLQSQKQCLQVRCLDQQAELATYDLFERCMHNCETGAREVLKMQSKHAEVGRLTYTKNIQRCLSIHGTPNTEGL
jgi:hypothetical protein